MRNIRNIIFDFGGVIINIDPDAIFRHVINLGVKNMEMLHELLLENQIYRKLETGQISPAEFRSAIRDSIDLPLHDEDIDKAWNAMILDIPRERVKFLNRLKTRYNIFLLSNTNAIHYLYYDRYFRETYDYPSLSSFFSKAWYSYLLGVRKPDPEIFSKALADGQLNPAQTAFVDDLEINVNAAATLGIYPVHLSVGKEIMDLFDENLELRI